MRTKFFFDAIDVGMRFYADPTSFRETSKGYIEVRGVWYDPMNEKERKGYLIFYPCNDSPAATYEELFFEDWYDYEYVFEE